MSDDLFPKTSWTLIARAGAGSSEGRAALSALCSAYRFPVYAFIRRRCGNPEDAQDHTQSFFAQLLERNDIAKADRTEGRKFRAWLLICVKNHLNNEYKREHAQKRLPAGGIESLSVDDAENAYTFEPHHELTPERMFDRQFALSLLSRVMTKLREKYVAAGRGHVFEALKGCLSGETIREPYERLAISLGMNSANAVRQASFDLRGHYKNFLLAEVAEIVHPADDASVKKELSHLLAAISDE